MVLVMLSPRFISVCALNGVRSPQSAVRSPQSSFYSDRNSTVTYWHVTYWHIHTDRVNQHKHCRQYERRRTFIYTELGQLFCLWRRLWFYLALGKWLLTALLKQWNRGHLGLRTKVILWELNSFPILTLMLGLCCIFCPQKSRPAKLNYTFPPLIYSVESSVRLIGRKVEGTKPAAKPQLSRTHFVLTCLHGF